MREDIQEVRRELHLVHSRIDALNESFNKRLDTRFTWLIATMVALSAMLAGLIKF